MISTKMAQTVKKTEQAVTKSATAKPVAAKKPVAPAKKTAPKTQKP